MHSNHLAPSRDIALAFAHYSRVRHLLSGGRHFFRDSEQSRKYLQAFGPPLAIPGNAPSDYAGNAGIWRQVSSAEPHMQVLLNQHSCYVGPSISPNPHFGTCVLNKQAQHPYSNTDTAHHFPTFTPVLASLPMHSTYFTAKSMTLLNGDVCRIGDWVLFSLFAGTEAPTLGHVHEILVSTSVSKTQQYPRPDVILLQQAVIAEWVEPYQMPRISISNNWAVANITVSGLLSKILAKIDTF